MKLKWIETENYEIDTQKQYPASYVRKDFQVDAGKQCEKAELLATAHGVYIPYMNGKRISQEILLPYFTDYTRRTQYQKFDVTELIRPGNNTFIAEVGDGWYRGHLGAFNKNYNYGKKLAFAGRLMISYSDGTQEIIDTDSTWLSTQDGPLRQNDLKIHETYDAGREDALWKLSEKIHWNPCVECQSPEKLIENESVPVIEQEHFPVVRSFKQGDDTILDFGQNMAGYVEFQVTGRAGHEVTLVFGEAVNEKGEFTLANIQGNDKEPKKEDAAMQLGQRLTYILKEGQQTYKPHFLICGFRYVQLKNWPEEVVKENFQAIAVYSDLPRTGYFRCSNAEINQLVHCTEWSQKSNFVDIPTDCPQRERAGWTGDMNVFQETANYMVDTRQFLTKWMKDFVGMQDKEGGLPYIVPDVPAIGSSRSSAGWSDAISTIPLGQYEVYGDLDIVRETYDAAAGFVDFNVKRAAKKSLRHIAWTGKHQKYILDTGFHYGEWLEPGSSNIKDALKAMVNPDAEVATAWFYCSAKNVARMAELLGKKEDQARYTKLAGKIREAYRKQFLPQGKVTGKRMCKYVRPLYMGLAEDREAGQIAADLNQLCMDNDYKIGTGFLTTYQLLPVLTDYGYRDTAYKVLLNRQAPGWLYEVGKGATTIWEGWDAIQEDGSLKPLSQNHYSPGTVVSWLYSRCAGIRPAAPGYKRTIVRPVIGGNLDYVEAGLKTVSGNIDLKWRIEEKDGHKEFTIELEHDDSMTVDLVMPDGTERKDVPGGIYQCACER